MNSAIRPRNAANAASDGFPALAFGVLVLMLACACAMPAKASPSILQRGYDSNVSGANLNETVLNAGNVSTSTFGLLFKLPVDDAIFAQPLYVPNVAIPNMGSHNVVYVATMSDTLYAFDADTGGAPLWSANFASRVGAVAVPMAQFAFSGNRNIVGNLGILSTPVIDPSTNMLYLVACTLENNTLAYRLHAVDITTGAEPYGPGTLISASYYGSVFDARFQTQRVSLALAGNQVVFGFGAVQLEYAGGYAGWVMAYNKQTLQQSGAFATVTNGSGGGGVWQSGRPPAVDSSGKVYLFTGNGFSNGYDGVNNFSETVLKLDPAAGLQLLDWFTPSNWSALDASDLDLSSSGPMLIPGTNLLTGGGKPGVFYVLNTANLGKESANDSQIVQKLQLAASYVSGGPVYWQRSAANGGPLLYNWGASDWVKAYAFNGTTLNTSPSFQGSGTQQWPGGILTLSANGDQPGSGVLWATVATTSGAWSNPPVPGELHAFSAADVSQELWNSNQNASQDAFGNFAKFVPPTVANGKVYVATWSSQVAVYGLQSSFSLSSSSLSFGNQITNTQSAPSSVTVTNTGKLALPITNIALSTSGSQPFSQTNTCGTSIAVGASCSINVVFNPGVSGAASATLSINAGNGLATQTVALSGTGLAVSYAVSANSVTFGPQVINAASPPTPVTITNTGQAALSIQSLALSSGGSQPFSQTNTCGTSLAVGAGCTINVVFNPAVSGAASATLSINTGNGLATQTVALSGTGVALSYSISANSLTFGTQALNVASLPLAVSLTNTGQAALSIQSLALSSGGSQPFSQTNTCGTSLAAGASCSINVVFDPGVSGPASATLSISAGNGLATRTVALSGSGVAPSFSVSASSLTFGAEPINVVSAPLTITLRDTSTLALPITFIALSTPGAQAFSETNNCGSNVAAGGSCNINISFDPSAAGSVLAALGINTSDGSSMIQLLGNGNFKVVLTASAPSVTAGEPVTLTWTSAPGASCTPQGGNPSDHWSGTLGNSGSQAVVENTAGAFNYGLSCQASGIQETGSVAVMNTLPTVTLAATATAVTVGGSVTLNWTSSDATSCVASGGQTSDGWSGAKSMNGTSSVTPNAPGNVTYTMTCSSGTKSAIASAEVTASAPSVPASSGGGGGGSLGVLELLSLLALMGLRLILRHGDFDRSAVVGGKIAPTASA